MGFLLDCTREKEKAMGEFFKVSTEATQTETGVGVGGRGYQQMLLRTLCTMGRMSPEIRARSDEQLL